LSQEHERLRIAIGLHDQVGQALALLAGKLDELETPGGPPQHARAIAEMRALLARTIEATRALTFDLASPVLHQLGLEAALRGLGERLQRRHGVGFRFDAGRKRRPSSEATNVIVYRCVRELLRNVADHARARQATIRITAPRGRLAVTVEDDGVGFDPSGLGCGFGPGGRFGLYSIAEQLRLIGGRLDIDSVPGEGTRVVVAVPVELATARGGRS
jgi:signal transduction histidine kinase